MKPENIKVGSLYQVIKPQQSFNINNMYEDLFCKQIPFLVLKIPNSTFVDYRSNIELKIAIVGKNVDTFSFLRHEFDYIREISYGKNQ